MKYLTSQIFDSHKLIATLRKYGPLALLALMPGGTLIALALWLTQRWNKDIEGDLK